ncbi:baeRF3 domain-containing protein, partial [Veillonella sp. ZSJB6]|uniref:baeRF3 domain-containing protein n=1 Tax=Veillonella sp. ZSJB6 TaxID=3451359 RepID=UPI003F657B77
MNNRLAKEIKGGSERQQTMSELTFPINNSTLPNNSKADRTGSSDDDMYLKEFFNRVDKSLQELYNKSPLPVIL